jgi:hypothetical protein
LPREAKPLRRGSTSGMDKPWPIVEYQIQSTQGL